MMKAVIFLMFLAFACGNVELLGKDRCSLGPSYWCSHLSKAKECGAVDHCIQAVWTKQKLTTPVNPECQLCETVLNFTRKYLADKATQKEIINAATYFCNATSGIPQIKTYCDEILPELPTIFTFLANPALSNAQLCSFVISDCKASSAVLHKGDQQEQYNGDICSDCKAFIGDIEQLITSNSTKSQMVAMVQQMVCGKFGPLEETCDNLVDTYLPQLLDYVGSFVDPDLDCKDMGLCSAGSLQKVKKYQIAMAIFKGYFNKYAGKDSNGDICSDCKAFIGDIEQLITSNNTKSQMVAMVQQMVCVKFGPLEETCDNLVDTYLPQLLDYVGSFVDPELDCKAIGFCSAGSSAKLVKYQMPITIFIGYFDKYAGEHYNGDICSDCQAFIGDIEQLITSNSTKSQMVAMVQQMCGMFGPLEETCDNLVDTYLPQLLDYVGSFVDPDMDCRAMGFCSAGSSAKLMNYQTSMAMFKGYINKNAGKKMVSGAMECTVCKDIILAVNKLASSSLVQNAKAESIENYICPLFGASESQCKIWVAKYGTQMATFLSNEKQANTFCQMLLKCTSSEPNLKDSFGKILYGVKSVSHEDTKLYFKKHLLGGARCKMPGYVCANRQNAERCGYNYRNCKRFRNLLPVVRGL